MSGTNDFFSFGTSCHQGHDFAELPKGVAFSLALNPYNGLVVVSYNKSPVAIEVVEEIMQEMQRQMVMLMDALERDVTIGDLAAYCRGELVLDDFDACPFCGCKPIYDDDSDEIICCGGRLRMGGFENRMSAVRSWNSRGAFVRVA